MDIEHIDHTHNAPSAADQEVRAAADLYRQGNAAAGGGTPAGKP